MVDALWDDVDANVLEVGETRVKRSARMAVRGEELTHDACMLGNVCMGGMARRDGGFTTSGEPAPRSPPPVHHTSLTFLLALTSCSHREAPARLLHALVTPLHSPCSMIAGPKAGCMRFAHASEPEGVHTSAGQLEARFSSVIGLGNAYSLTCYIGGLPNRSLLLGKALAVVQLCCSVRSPWILLVWLPGDHRGAVRACCDPLPDV